MCASVSPGGSRTFDVDLDAADELMRWKQQLQADAVAETSVDDAAVRSEYQKRLQQHRYSRAARQVSVRARTLPIAL